MIFVPDVIFSMVWLFKFNLLLDLFDHKLQAMGYDPDTQPAERRKGIIEEIRTRGTTIEEIVNSSLYFFSDEITMDEKASKKFLTKEISPVLEKLCSAIDKIDEYKIENIKAVFNEILSSEDLKIGKLAQPLRVAVTRAKANRLDGGNIPMSLNAISARDKVNTVIKSWI